MIVQWFLAILRPALILLVQHEVDVRGEVENLDLYSYFVEAGVLLTILHKYARKRGYFRGSSRQAIQSNPIARAGGFSRPITAGRV